MNSLTDLLQAHIETLYVIDANGDMCTSIALYSNCHIIHFV